MISFLRLTQYRCWCCCRASCWQQGGSSLQAAGRSSHTFRRFLTFAHCYWQAAVCTLSEPSRASWSVTLARNPRNSYRLNDPFLTAEDSFRGLEKMREGRFVNVCEDVVRRIATSS